MNVYSPGHNTVNLLQRHKAYGYLLLSQWRLGDSETKWTYQKVMIRIYLSYLKMQQKLIPIKKVGNILNFFERPKLFSGSWISILLHTYCYNNPAFLFILFYQEP